MKKTVLVMILLALSIMTGSPAAAETPSDEVRFLDRTRPLTLQGRRSGEGYFSHDAKHLIFQSERDEDNPFYQMFVLDLGTGDTWRVSPGIGKTTCGFFRPGTDELLYASTHLDSEARDKQVAEIEFRASGKERRYSWDYDETFDIFSSRRNGQEIRRLTDAVGYDAEAAYSPDGESIVFCSLREAYPADRLSAEDEKRLEVDPAFFGEIFIMEADGSKQRRLTEWAGYDGGPFFSPDGGRIVWRHFDESGMIADIMTMRTDGTDRRQLTDMGAMCWAPFYHPSGRYVVFTSNEHGFSNFELFIVDVEGRVEPVRVTHTDGFDGLPSFSPRGDQLVWTSNRTASGESQLFLADWNHEWALTALSEAPVRAAVAADEDAGTAGQERDDRSSQDAATGASPEIPAADLGRDVAYLASDELEGRMTGSAGTRLAADYVAERFEALGLEPKGDDGFMMEFPFTSGVKVHPEENSLNVTAGDERHVFLADEDFGPLAFSADGEVGGEVVFAGYGLSVPGKLGEGYDSYGDLDVDGKIVLVLRYTPEDVEMERRQELNMYAGLRYKAMIARERGARALLVVTGPNSPNAGELVPIKFDQSMASSGIVVASVTGKVASLMFETAGKDLEAVQSELDVENPHFEGAFPLDGVRAELVTAVERQKNTGRNVIAALPGRTREWIVIGGHYDHIGHGEIGSLAHKGEEGMIHNGADDNASGTATVLGLAAALTQVKADDPDRFERGVIFALWSGEELGNIGSSHFVNNPPVAIDDVVAYLNFDMVGRLRDNKLTLQGTGSSDTWADVIERKNVAAGFNLVLQEDPYLPTDVTSFYPKGVPVLSFFTGSHEDYNRPTDDPETLNYDGMERIAGLALAISLDLVARDERPAYVKVEPGKSEAGGRGTLRAYLGTIPDYASDDVEGVKLSGVRADGPADKAGVMGGDIIVEFAGQKITNIYDYTYALDAVKIGEPVAVVVMRDGERLELTIVPEARK